MSSASRRGRLASVRFLTLPSSSTPQSIPSFFRHPGSPSKRTSKAGVIAAFPASVSRPTQRARRIGVSRLVTLHPIAVASHRTLASATRLVSSTGPGPGKFGPGSAYPFLARHALTSTMRRRSSGFVTGCRPTLTYPAPQLLMAPSNWPRVTPRGTRTPPMPTNAGMAASWELGAAISSGWRTPCFAKQGSSELSNLGPTSTLEDPHPTSNQLARASTTLSTFRRRPVLQFARA